MKREFGTIASTLIVIGIVVVLVLLGPVPAVVLGIVAVGFILVGRRTVTLGVEAHPPKRRPRTSPPARRSRK